MKTIFILTFLASIFCYAGKTYDVKMEVSLDGNVISAPKVTAVEGKKAVVTEKNKEGSTSIEVIASSDKTATEKGVKLNLVVSKFENGKKTVWARPEVLLEENKAKEIEVLQIKGDRSAKMTLKVKASTVSL